MKTLILYYSQARGNTKRIAQMIQERLHAEMEQIQTRVPYTGSYDAIVNQGKREVDSGYTPEIVPVSADLSAYDCVLIGTPTWWYTMAPAVRTFFQNYDLSEKTVIPFATNGGWPRHVLKDMEQACPGAKCVLSHEIRFDSTGGDTLETPLQEIHTWIDDIVSLQKGGSLS